MQSFSSGLLSAPVSSIALTEAERSWLATHPVIRVGPDPEFRPIEFFDASGAYKGLAADYLRLVSGRLGLQFKIVQLDNWDEVVRQAKSREIDMWSAASATPQRLEFMNFTQPMVEVPAVILVRKQVKQDLTMADLKGLKVAVVSGYAAHDFMLDRYPWIELDPVPNLETALRKVSFGMVDAMVGNLATATYYMEQQGITNLRVAGSTGEFYRWAFAIRNDWPELRSILDKGLKSLSPEDHQKIFSEWIHITAQSWKPSPQFYLLLLLFLLGLSVVGGYAWNRTLKRLVVQRTDQLNTELEEKKQTEVALTIRDRAITAATNGIAIIDVTKPDHSIIYVNPAFEKIAGYKAIELVGRAFPFFDDEPENSSAITQAKTAIHRGLPCQVQLHSARKEGSRFWNELSLSPVRDSGGGLTHYITVVNDITERIRNEETVRQIAVGVSALTGNRFFEQLTSHLAESLGVKYVLLGKLQIGVEETIRTQAVWARGQLVDNFNYALADTPCSDVIHRGACAFPDHIQQHFPRDDLLKEMGAESYIGIPLRSTSGDILGLLAVLDTVPIQNPDYILSMLTIFASRASAELDRQRADLALRSSEEYYRVLFESANDGILTFDNSRFTSCNAKMEAIYGCDKSEIIGFGPEKFSPQYQPDGTCSSERAYHLISAALSGKPQLFEWVHQQLDGTPIYTEVSLNRVYSEGSSVLTARIHDITDRKRRDEETRLAASVFNGTTEGIAITDARGILLQVNKAFTEITGFESEEVLGKTPRLLRSDYHDEAFYQSFWSDLTTKGYWQGEIWNRRKDGEAHPVWQNISAIRDEMGDIVQYISVFSDITDKKRSEQRIEHLAHYDVLTDLPNRVLFNERCEHALTRARRDGHQLVVMFLDLDRFKHINDSLGHPIGDRLLQQVAKRLDALIREEDTVARLGGDEFVVVLEDVIDTHVVAPVAEKILAAFNEPFELKGNQLHVSSSIGIAIYPEDGHDVTTLVRNADAAMYRAKESGRNNYQFYTQEMTATAHARVLLESNLRQAVEQQQLVLHYHPQFDLVSGKLTGSEALVRWIHPEMGLVPPDNFIPLAEETGLILSIGEWVLREACGQAKQWLDAGRAFGTIAVNVSGHQIERGDIVELVRQVLWETRLPAALLELEITESFIMKHPEEAIKTLGALKQLGVSLAIDDFGTGYSSLSYLKRLPIDKLKIDRSFVSDVPGGRADAAITRAVIALGKGLSLRVIAEGVENDAQRTFLEQEGCNEAQGFLYTRPLAAIEFQVSMERLMENRSSCLQS
ncbi:MAG: EAL domain-containing protein [Sedimenticola sp.]|nr:EAL domain-containing protein [Sedimenticola sp.]